MLATLLKTGEATVMHAASMAASTAATPAAAAGAAHVSFFDALSFKTARFPANGSFIVDGLAAANLLPPSPYSSLLPSNSTLLACALAVGLYVISWTVLGSRTAPEEDDETRHASFNPLTSPKKPPVVTHRAPLIIRLLQLVFRICTFFSQCLVFLVHSIMQRCLPWRAATVYLRGFNCASMPDDWTVSHERFRRTALQNFGLDEKAVEFSMRLLARSGIGEQSYFPPGITSFPPDLSMQSQRAEAEYILFNALDGLFASTGIRPRDVDILIVNCSLFAPTPSLAAMIMRQYKMREDTESYNLGGMGCSAGIISVHLAKQLLQRNANSLAIVVSTEQITQNMYTGKETNMLLQNCLFRSGGAAIALTNKSTDYAWGRCKYILEHTVRTTLAADSQAYGCVFQDEDSKGKRGVRLGKELMGVAGRAMQRNISRLAPLILPWSEQIKFALNLIARKLDVKFRIVDKLTAMGIVAPPPPPTEEELRKLDQAAQQTPASPEEESRATRYKSRIPEYTPDFHTAVSHICIHAGGRAVIDAIQRGLKLSDEDVAPSRAVLRRYGNTSSSSIWYEFRYIEQHREVKRGERVWQLGFGSGFKCNSAIWRRI